MGTSTVSGVPQKVADHLKDRWRLKPGDVYDGTYPTDFVKKEVFPAVREIAKELDLKSPFETDQPVSIRYMGGSNVPERAAAD